MPTNNTSEASHERDEELEKFIEETIANKESLCTYYQECGFPKFAIKDIMRDCYAFASKRAFQEGRLAGLKEMDCAWCWNERPDGERITSLRMEYQGSMMSPQYQPN